MDLKDFISQSLEQIVRGIEEAGNNLKDSTAIVSPEKIVDISKEKNSGSYKRNNGEYTNVSEVMFDVAVTVTEGTESKGGIGIAIGTIGIGAQGKTDNTNSSISKLSFSVPMILPYTKE